MCLVRAIDKPNLRDDGSPALAFQRLVRASFFWCALSLAQQLGHREYLTHTAVAEKGDDFVVLNRPYALTHPLVEIPGAEWIRGSFRSQFGFPLGYEPPLESEPTTAARNGRHYYYVRLLQDDEMIAWSSRSSCAIETFGQAYESG